MAKFTKSFILYLLLIFAPVSFFLDQINSNSILIFIVSIISLIPLAKLIGDSTEHLASHYGSTVGSLLNVTFGNAAEIIIGIIDYKCRLDRSCKSFYHRCYFGKYHAYFWFEYNSRWNLS